MAQDIQKLFEDIPPDRFIQILGGKKPSLGFGNYEDLAILGQDPAKFHCIGVQSVKFADLQSYLETNYFKPTSGLNEEFELRVLKWHETIFIIVTIPFWKREFCYEAAERMDLVLTSGTPFVGDEVFPLASACSVVVEDKTFQAAGFEIQV